ncbi:MAG: hypothetical protein KBS74_03715, partial [Clostridiales bacterium]|nr:hypothetical protein [Candidatus Cacconaster stercorequi]
MIEVSQAFKSAMLDSTDFRCRATITMQDSTTIQLTDADFTIGGSSIVDGAAVNGFPIGVAIGRSVKLSLMNSGGRFDSYDFSCASVHLWITFKLPDDTTEEIDAGIFTVTTPETPGATLIISASDDMYKTDNGYSTSGTFPMSLAEMFTDACSTCGITPASAQFRNSDFVVTSIPAGVSTYRELFGHIAGIAGGNAKINREGKMEIVTYDFSDEAPRHDLSMWGGLTSAAESIMINGVVSGEYHSGGEDGYLLAIDNPLISGNEQDALDRIADIVCGAYFRRFSGDHISYPLVECMDLAMITDAKSNQWLTVITDVTFNFGGFTSMTNSATSAIDNAATYISATEKVKGELTDQISSEVEDINRTITEQEASLTDTVERRMDQLTATLTGDYVAQSEFGSYVEALSA